VTTRHAEGSATAQRELWGRRARDWADLQEGQTLPLFRAGLEALGIVPGIRLLDVACGSGMFCRLAADAGAIVSGYDAAPELLEIARERTPEGEFYEGDIERLPWLGESFEVVTGFDAFQYAARPREALREAARVVSPDGRVLIAVWGRPEQCEAGAVVAALARLMPAGAAEPWGLSEPGALEELLSDADLTPERSEEVTCVWRYSTLEGAVRAQLSSGPAVAAIRESGEDAVRRAMEWTLERFRDASGQFVLENVFRYVVARP
jgi:2-polyprenyl-3-methyl-5-hydroxy-6-metoxy-1,4-benzoquinol methylase